MAKDLEDAQALVDMCQFNNGACVPISRNCLRYKKSWEDAVKASEAMQQARVQVAGELGLAMEADSQMVPHCVGRPEFGCSAPICHHPSFAFLRLYCKGIHM